MVDTEESLEWPSYISYQGNKVSLHTKCKYFASEIF